MKNSITPWSTNSKYLKELEAGSQRDICTPMFTAVLFTIAKTLKQPKCPFTDEWINKMWYIRTMPHYPVLKRKFGHTLKRG